MSPRPAVLVLAVLASSAVVAVPADAAGEAARKYHRSAVRATNDVRVERERVALERGGCLQRIAVERVKELAAEGDLEHQDLDAVLEECDLSLAGENLAAGFTTGRKAVDDGWMHSTSHRRNLLDRRFRKIAVAARRGADDRWYVVQLFGRHA